MRSGLLTILLALFLVTGHTQPLMGCYYEQHEGIGESDTRYWFYDDGTFRCEMWDDVGSWIAMGEFDIHSDSLFLRMHDIPAWIIEKQVLSEFRTDTLTTVTVINPWRRNARVLFKYQILQGDEIVEKGTSDPFGRIAIQLREAQVLKIWEDLATKNLMVQWPIVREFEGQTVGRNYILMDSSFRNRPIAIVNQQVAYSFRHSRKKGTFKLKMYDGWKTFVHCRP